MQHETVTEMKTVLTYKFMPEFSKLTEPGTNSVMKMPNFHVKGRFCLYEQPKETVQTLIRGLLLEPSDQGLHYVQSPV